ncbi:MAG: response regulator, partial [Blastocatellia bacterium]
MGNKILLADNNITMQKAISLTFAKEGIDVVAVSDGEMAERRLAEINPDLVLADIFMPGRNGYELCQYVKESPGFQNTPVVLLVGSSEPFDAIKAKQVHADAHLAKPFESKTLVETVRKLIAARSSSLQPKHLRPSSGSSAPDAERLPDPSPSRTTAFGSNTGLGREEVDSEMEVLEAAAESQDEYRFVQAVKTLDWRSRTGRDVLVATRLALKAGAYITARELSAMGAELFPDDAELQRFALVLAPPKVVAMRPAQGSGIRANRDWLKA